MNNYLENYKASKLDELTKTFNANLLTLRNILVANIKKINKMNIFKNIKIKKIKFYLLQRYLLIKLLY